MGVSTKIKDIPLNLKIIKDSYDLFSVESYRAYDEVYDFQNYVINFNFFVNKFKPIYLNK
jgi:hypothetical protein